MTPLLVTFARRVDEPFDHSLGALQRWHPTTTRHLDVRCATIDAPDDGEPNRYRLMLRLKGRGRPLPMELRVTPWSPTAGTHIELLPLRRVRPSHRYFRTGRSVLEDVVATIVGSSPATHGRQLELAPRCLSESA
jgi:hypothetical protein